MSERKADISIVDVARRAKVSLGTVSRVFNRNPRVAPELRRRVLLRSRELGFVPKTASHTIALITGRLSPALPVGYTSVMTALLWRYLAAAGYAVELIDADNLDLLYESHARGAIGIVFDDRLVTLASIPNLPLLTINNPQTQRGIHSIRTDHYQQGLLATRHLIDHGHREIGFLSIQDNEWGSTERRRGYEAAMAERGLPLAAGLCAYTLDHPPYDILSRWMRKGVTAILNFSEDAGLEVVHIASNVLGRKIGHDLSLICLEDLPIYQYLSPPMTTVRQPLEDVAKLAVETITKLCGEVSDSQIAVSDAHAASSDLRPQTPTPRPQTLDLCLPTQLIERDSVATLHSRPQ